MLERLVISIFDLVFIVNAKINNKNISLPRLFLNACLGIVIGVIKLSKLSQLFPSMAGKEESCVLSGMHLNVSPELPLRVWHGHRCLT